MRIPLGSRSGFPEGEGRLVRAGDDKVMVFHLTDGFFATQHRCTHLFASLERGKVLDDKCIQCPLHKAKFNIRTGEVEKWANFPPGIQLLNGVRGEKDLKTFVVEEEGDNLFLVL